MAGRPGAVFHVFVANAIDAARLAAERAAISFERVVESVAVEAETDPSARADLAEHVSNA